MSLKPSLVKEETRGKRALGLGKCGVVSCDSADLSGKEEAAVVPTAGLAPHPQGTSTHWGKMACGIHVEIMRGG